MGPFEVDGDVTRVVPFLQRRHHEGAPPQHLPRKLLDEPDGHLSVGVAVGAAVAVAVAVVVANVDQIRVLEIV